MKKTKPMIEEMHKLEDLCILKQEKSSYYSPIVAYYQKGFKLERNHHRF